MVDVMNTTTQTQPLDQSSPVMLAFFSFFYSRRPQYPKITYNKTPRFLINQFDPLFIYPLDEKRIALLNQDIMVAVFSHAFYTPGMTPPKERSEEESAYRDAVAEWFEGTDLMDKFPHPKDHGLKVPSDADTWWKLTKVLIGCKDFSAETYASTIAPAIVEAYEGMLAEAVENSDPERPPRLMDFMAGALQCMVSDLVLREYGFDSEKEEYEDDERVAQFHESIVSSQN